MTLRPVPAPPPSPVTVAHLTSVHGPGDPRILLKECATLAGAGYDVTLVAPADGDHERNGVAVRAVRARRHRLGRLLFTVPAVYLAARRTGADVFHFHDPELIGVGMLLRVRGATVVYDVREDLPRQLLGGHLPGPLRRPLSAFAGLAEAAAGRVMSRVVAATPTIAARFPPERTVLVRSFPLLTEFAHAELPAADPETPSAVYVGGLAHDRGAEQLVAAAHLLGGSVRFDLAGPFRPPSLADELTRRPGWSAVRYHGAVGRAMVVALLRSASVGLCTLLPTPSHRDALPVGLFEYMAAGLPVVASDFPLWREIVAGAGCGLLVDPTDPAAIAQAVGRLVDRPDEAAEMGARGLAAARGRYDWVGEGEALLDCYCELAGPALSVPAVTERPRAARTTRAGSAR